MTSLIAWGRMTRIFFGNRLNLSFSWHQWFPSVPRICRCRDHVKNIFALTIYIFTSRSSILPPPKSNMAIAQCFKVTVGVLALQGAFNEHIQCLRSASEILATKSKSTSKDPKGDFSVEYKFIEVRNEAELNSCDALIIPGGESTAISLVAQRSNLLEPLRSYVK